MSGNIPLPTAECNESNISGFQLAMIMTNKREQLTEPTDAPTITSSIQNDAESFRATENRTQTDDDCLGNASKQEEVEIDVWQEMSMQKSNGQQEQLGTNSDSTSSIMHTNGLHAESKPGTENDKDRAQTPSTPRTGSAAFKENILANELFLNDRMNNYGLQSCRDVTELFYPEDGEEHIR